MSDLRVVLKRSVYEADRTLGWLSVWNGPVQVYRKACIELPWKDNAPRTSCVPAGTYPIVREHSPAFREDLWELKNVPGRSECKVHAANYPTELKGCIAPALFHADINKDGRLDGVSSRKALAMFHQALFGLRECTITIEGDGRDVLMSGMNGCHV